MARGVYKFEVDWDHDGAYGNANADVTADVMSTSPWTWGRGRAGDSTLTQKSNAGTLSFVLNNSAGKYSSFNTSGALYGKLLPGRRIRVKMGLTSATTLVWSGRLDSIVPDAKLYSITTAKLKAFGVLGTIAAGKARTSRRTDILTSAAIGVVLDDIGWPAGARDINTGQTTMSYWFFGSVKGSGALSELRKVEDTESGWIRESEADEVVFEDRHYRLSGARITSQKTYADDGTAGAILYQDIPQSDPVKGVFNKIIAEAPSQSLASLAVLWTLGATGADSPYIGTGETQRFIAEYPTPSAINQDIGAVWTTSAATTDYTFNTASDGSGTDLVGNLTVSVVKALDMMVISMANGSGDPGGYLTKLQARGTAVQAGAAQKIEEFNQDSIDTYGEREFPIPAKFLPSMQEAVDYARYVLALNKDVSPRMKLRYLANADDAHLTEAFTRGLSDRVTVKSNAGTFLGINEDFFVESEHHDVRDGGAAHWVTLTLSSAEQTGRVIVLDTGPGLDTGMLGY